jgi:HEAT repeat protein
MNTRAGNKRKVLGLVIGLALVGMVAVLATRGEGTSSDTEDGQGEARRLSRQEAFPESPPPSLLAPERPDDGKRAEAAVASWRNAILVRNANAVVKLDAAFLEAPAMYLDALKSSAASDENERVRAFSTRELGKFRRLDLAPTFEQLLNDKSPFVRKNAAWSLGELSGGADGRAAARRATPELRRLVKRDPADDVRVAARAALEKID